MNKQILTFALLGAVLLSASAILLLQKSPLEQDNLNSTVCAQLQPISPYNPFARINENYTVTNTCAVPVFAFIKFQDSSLTQVGYYQTHCIQPHQAVDITIEGCHKIVDSSEISC